MQRWNRALRRTLDLGPGCGDDAPALTSTSPHGGPAPAHPTRALFPYYRFYMHPQHLRVQDRRTAALRSSLRRALSAAWLVALFAGVAPNAIITVAAADTPLLRVAKLRYHEANHAHRDVAGEFRLLSAFATRAGMRIKWLDAVQPEALAAQLARGEADLVVADLAPSLTGSGTIPSYSMGAFDTVVVGRAALQATTPLDLAGLRIAVSLASPLWRYLVELERTVPDLSVVVMPDSTTRTELLAGISAGHYDCAVVSVRAGAALPGDQAGLKRLFTLADGNAAVWHFAASASALRDRVNAYLQRYHAALAAPQPAFGDLDRIRARHVLRVITRVDPRDYFLHRGRRAGFEYELVQKFARQAGLAVEFKVANSDAQALEWLRTGVGDIASLRLNADRIAADPTLVQSREYFHSAAVIVNHADTAPLTAATLAGKRVAVLQGSVQHRALAELVAGGTGLTAVVLNADAALDEIATTISAGVADAAIVDAHALAALKDAYPLIQSGASVASAYRYAWTLRRDNPRLAGAVDHFLRGEFRRETYNVLARRYFRATRPAGFADLGRLSPYDDLVRRHAEAFDFDWRLIVAQMYQESQFDPHAESSAGALGLMQLLPATALSVGVSDPLDPEAGIRGGVAYLDRLRRRFEASLAPRERIWFALAAYNVGFNRVERARAAAAEHGLDPDRWFGHVEKVMRDMADNNACRCGQTIVYVRGIRSLYTTYSRLHETLADNRALPAAIPAI